jgi:fido (protein-threonine AMPylation protein)
VEDEAYQEADFESGLTYEQHKLAWDIGAGLQLIDGRVPSDHAQSLMAAQARGETTYKEVIADLRAKYANDGPDAQSETDETMVRIAQIITEPGFTVSPGSLLAIHKRIFDGVLDDPRWEGTFRDVSITEAEPLLGGRSVAYTPGSEVAVTLRAALPVGGCCAFGEAISRPRGLGRAGARGGTLVR